MRSRCRGRASACDDIRGQSFPSERFRLSAMRENLHRFFRAARGAGVHVSPAESIDAMRAVSTVGISDRAVLRDALLLTLAKSEDEKKALATCFDLFFASPEPSQAGSEAAEGGEAAERSGVAHDQSGQAAQDRGAVGGDDSRLEAFGALAQMLLSQDPGAISA